MVNPTDFYNAQCAIHKKKSAKLFQRLGVLSVLRLSVFVLTIVGVYLTYQSWLVACGICVFGIALFLILLSRYSDLKSKRALHKRLEAINIEELRIESGEFHHRDTGFKYRDSSHYYSLDIDLFGKGSFFQYLNRTSIQEGTDTLVNYLLANNISGIEQRQKGIKELSILPEWRQKYTAIAQGVQVEDSANSIITWLNEYKPFLGKRQFWYSIIFSILSIGILGLGILELIPIKYAGYWLLLGLAITGRHLKKINILAQNTQKAKDTFRQYALLLGEIENQNFESDLLTSRKEKIKSDGISASDIFKRFSKALDALDNRNNIFSAIFGNGFLLWDIRQAYNVEQWIFNHGHKVEDWFEVVTFFDAYNSLGNYAFNHQEMVFPEITESRCIISAKNLGHPLLQSEKRVDSDVTIDAQQFFIVTGANMAGKSTFLRTVALHIVMANMGLPVCATESTYKPIKLITSMRTTDSLTDDSSYFFSELTRLKFIVEAIENNSSYFIILDEILKGTNSTDKAIGSRKFVERLVKLTATGIIATHDLSLTEIESELEPVKNYFFDAQIINEELFFDYKLKEGVCENMNASFLLKKMNIVN